LGNGATESGQALLTPLGDLDLDRGHLYPGLLDAIVVARRGNPGRVEVESADRSLDPGGQVKLGEAAEVGSHTRRDEGVGGHPVQP